MRKQQKSHTISISERSKQNPLIHLIFSRMIIFVRSELDHLPCLLWCTKNIFLHAYFCSHCSLIEDRRLENNSWKWKDIQNSVWYLLNFLCTANTKFVSTLIQKNLFLAYNFTVFIFKAVFRFYSCLCYSNHHVIMNCCILSEIIICIRNFTSIWEKRAQWLASCTDSMNYFSIQ